MPFFPWSWNWRLIGKVTTEFNSSSPPMPQDTPLYSFKSSMTFEAPAPLAAVNESPMAPSTWMSDGLNRCTEVGFSWMNGNAGHWNLVLVLLAASKSLSFKKKRSILSDDKRLTSFSYFCQAALLANMIPVWAHDLLLFEKKNLANNQKKLLL